MKNIIDYVENSLETFEERELNTADSVILSWLSYFHFPESIEGIRTWEGIRLQEIFRAESFEEMLSCPGGYKANIRLLRAICSSPRFRDLYISAFIDDKDFDNEKEFAAVTFSYGDRWIYVAYRGTDTTFLGWKEDFNMSFQYPVPSQKQAWEYLGAAAQKHKEKIYVGGHSKGGNLALYAALNAQDQVLERIERVFSHDGPGFPTAVLLDSRFKKLEGKLEKTVPQSSIIGLLMEDQCPIKIVKSKGLSLWQHNAYMWEMDGKDFIEMKELTANARFVDKTLSRWLKEVPLKEREEFIDTIYKIVNNENVKTFDDLKENWKTALPQMAGVIKDLDNSSKTMVGRTFKKLGSTAINNLPSLPELPKIDPAKGKEIIKENIMNFLKERKHNDNNGSKEKIDGDSK